MLIKNNEIRDWKDLQNKVCSFFQEMDYESQVSKTIELTRGKKEIDVFIQDKLASVNQLYLVECKNWSNNVPQEVVHSFQTVMEGAGANTGFIISKKGFQKGAYEAARFTNIHLLSFEEFQTIYGKEWFRKKEEQLKNIFNEFRKISSLHFDQFSPLPVINNRIFHNEELHERLIFHYRMIQSFIITPLPESFLSTSIKIYFDPLWDFKDCTKFTECYEKIYTSTRSFFADMISGAHKCLKNFNELVNEAQKSFNLLEHEIRDQRWQRTLNDLRNTFDRPLER